MEQTQISLTDEITQFYPSYQAMQQFRHLYTAAMREIEMRLDVLSDECSVTYAHNPIHHIETRLKSTDSIIAKLKRKGCPVTLESARENINDIAGVRAVCPYIDDVYRVEEMLLRQFDVELVDRTDYIKEPNRNGYRSLHLDLRVPIFLSDRTERVLAEVQLRTVAMDFWASLEHDLRYKADKSSLPAGINEEMLKCADEIAAIDVKMQSMYQRINESK